MLVRDHKISFQFKDTMNIISNINPRAYRFSKIILVITILINQLTAEKSHCSGQANNSPDPYENQVNDENIKTVLLFREGSDLTLPVINLNSGDRLELHFDDLSPQQRSFSYTLIHCNRLWLPSPMEQQEYLDGYGSGRIEKVTPSFNTTCDYFHYSLTFPAEEAMPRISGNYALVVYENNDPENLILVRQFYVTESLVTLDATVRQPSGEKYATGQEIEFSIGHEGYSILNPSGDLSIRVRQNGNSRSDQIIIKPRFVGPAVISYGGNDEIVFNGGNEFRYFDIKSMKYEAEHIARIDFQPPYYHVFLKNAEPRAYDPYFTQQDLNGRFYIEKERSEDRHTEADYVKVHFLMNAQIPYTDGEIYIAGELSDWLLTDPYRMVYDSEHRQYEKVLLLKQGYYNYLFAYLPEGSKKPDPGYLEGNHFETLNEYAFFVYHYDSSWDYDRLIAVKQIQSR